MWTINFKESTPIAFILPFIVTVNIYNLIFCSLNYDDDANEMLFGKDLKIKKYVILSQTILSVFAIPLQKKYTSIAVNLIKWWIFGPLVVTLFCDMVLTTTTAVYLLRDRNLDTFWNINDDARPMPAPHTLYFFAGLVLFVYFVFKLYATIITFSYVSTFVEGIGVSNDSHLTYNNDIERNTPSQRQSSPPPQYEQCILEFAKPPPYREIIRY